MRHFLFNFHQILRRKGLLNVKIVVKAVFNRGTNGELRIRKQVFHRHGHQMAGAVKKHLSALGIGKGNGRDGLILFDGSEQVGHLAVLQLDGEILLEFIGALGLEDVARAAALSDLKNLAKHGNFHNASLLAKWLGWLFGLVSVPDDPRRYARHNRVGRHVPGDDRPGAHDAAAAERNARHNGHAAANPAVVPDHHGADRRIALLAHRDIGAVEAVHHGVDEAVGPHHHIVADSGLFSDGGVKTNAGVVAQRYAAAKARMALDVDAVAAGGEHVPRAERAQPSRAEAPAAVGAGHVDGQRVVHDDGKCPGWFHKIPPFLTGGRKKARPHISAGAGEKIARGSTLLES